MTIDFSYPPNPLNPPLFKALYSISGYEGSSAREKSEFPKGPIGTVGGVCRSGAKNTA